MDTKTYFFVGITMWKQTGDDDDPNMAREALYTEVIEAPNTRSRVAQELYSHLVVLVNAARRAFKPAP